MALSVKQDPTRINLKSFLRRLLVPTSTLRALPNKSCRCFFLLHNRPSAFWARMGDWCKIQCVVTLRILVTGIEVLPIFIGPLC